MQLLTKYLNELNIPYTSGTLAKFERYYELLVEWNEKFNLTAITERDQVIIKHFADSLYGYPLVQGARNVVDIGCGAGFPSLPLAIVCPDVQFTLVDSLNKRVTFLDAVVAELGLSNVTPVHSRAEEYAREHRHSYDIAVARAVSALPTLLEYLVPVVKVGGKAICYKSVGVEQELASAEKAIHTLQCKLVGRRDYSILDTDMSRSLVVFSPFAKCATTYPRGKNKPKTTPL